MADIDIPEILAELTDAFNRYEQALVNNDLAVLDLLFWKDERTVRYGASENLYGYNAIAAFRAARSSVGLNRTLQNTIITTFGRDYGTTCTEFTREGSPRIGRQSQCWVRHPEGWRIVAAHVSLMEAQKTSSRQQPLMYPEL
jgi:hypothetical protein